jgi:toxin CcdB
MARLDVHLNPGGPGYLLDCQSDMLSHLSTRLVVPLLPPNLAPDLGQRLTPKVRVEGQEMIMMTNFTASVPRSTLGRIVGSLAQEHSVVMDAFDMLLTGY